MAIHWDDNRKRKGLTHEVLPKSQVRHQSAHSPQQLSYIGVSWMLMASHEPRLVTCRTDFPLGEDPLCSKILKAPTTLQFLCSGRFFFANIYAKKKQKTKLKKKSQKRILSKNLNTKLRFWIRKLWTLELLSKWSHHF